MKSTGKSLYLHARLDSIQYHINLIDRRYKRCPERLREARREVLTALNERKGSLLRKLECQAA